MSMKRCPVTDLPVRENPAWQVEHPGPGYRVIFDVIGTDIIHGRVIAEEPTYLDYIDAELFQSICEEMQLNGRKLFVVIDYAPINEVRLSYKQDYGNLFYNWGPWIAVLVVYNVRPEITAHMLGLGSLCPDRSQALIVGSYREAMEYIADYKVRYAPSEVPESPVADSLEEAVGRFFAASARLTWLDMLDQPIAAPQEQNEYRFFFTSLEEMRRDLQGRETLHQERIRRLKAEYGKREAECRVQMKLLLDENGRGAQQYEAELTRLRAILSEKDAELSRVARLFDDKISMLSKLCTEVDRVETGPELREAMRGLCRKMEFRRSAEVELSTELTDSDICFLGVLQERHPDLSERERRLSLFIKLNYATREIARSAGVSLRGMENIRYRLHKKLGLEKHQSLKNYFTALASQTCQD
ncbi:LuxR family transcriptional regulator [Chlorobium sp. N1]|uniref:helix-turn-helix transcriptional regulator n=1 Tax=Chlorobium sp. N1 TaxID=2491138 RepID=UPI00103C3C59|nr:LuxR family transcriptional regulator [Chlorobium sp. N1]TCD47071.1 LuxR family transcriptional regulator [Chlorobium sp. N1]